MTAGAIMNNPDQRLKPAFVQSVVFHVAVLGGLTALALWNPGVRLGGDQSSDAPVTVEAITIPLPSRGPENPVAEDTTSMVPPAPQEKAVPKPAEPDPEDAIAIPTPVAKAKQPMAPRTPVLSLKQLDNQIPSKTPQAASSPLLKQQSDGGSIGSSIDAVMGSRFAAYAARVKTMTTENWHTEDVDRSATLPPVRIRFTIHRDGHVSDVSFVRQSFNQALDASVQNAVKDARYPPLPPDYDKNTVQVEFTFQVRP